MGIITVNGLKVEFGEQLLFDNMTFEIQKGDRVALIGVNGCGKSTLFKVLTGEILPTDGTVVLAKNLNIGYMEQHVCRNLDRSAYNEVLSVFSELLDIEKQIEALNNIINNGCEELDKTVEKLSALQDRFNLEGGLTCRSRARSALLGLGFDDEQMNLPVGALSGGQRAKLQLAKLLLCNADFLLLDEPTNHLDTAAAQWLEDFLTGSRCGYLVISHDRYFLDKTTNRTFELENKKMTVYKGNYSAYLPQRAERRLTEQRVYDNTIKEINRLEGIIEQQRRWNREKNIKTAESKQKIVDRLSESLVRPDSTPDSIKFNLGINTRSGDDVLSVTDLSLAFDGVPLFDNVSMELHRGERVFLLGPNGCGKTSLIKTLLGKYKANSGRIRYGTEVKTGYYDQIQTGMDSEKTVFEEMADAFPAMTNTEIRSTLARFLFKNDDVFKPLSSLSGGERAKVLMTKLMLTEANFLLLDEPTNHLDISSCEALENALSGYEGTLLIVSHDRYLINSLADKIFYLTPHGIKVFEGNYEEFLEKYKPFDSNPEPQKAKEPKQNDYKNKKERDALRRKTRARLNRLEIEISEYEDKIAAENEALSSPDVAADYEKAMEITEKIAKAERELNSMYEEWENLSLELDK